MDSNRLQLSKDLILNLASEKNDSCEWLAKIRKTSEKRFLNDGIPLSFDEEWRLSSPSHFNKVSLCSSEENHEKAPSPFEKLKKISIVFLDGVFSKDSSDNLRANGIKSDFARRSCYR